MIHDKLIMEKTLFDKFSLRLVKSLYIFYIRLLQKFCQCEETKVTLYTIRNI